MTEPANQRLQVFYNFFFSKWQTAEGRQQGLG